MLCNENIFSISNYLANFFQYFFFKLCSFQAYNTVYIEVTDMYVQLLRQTWAKELKSAYISDMMLKSNFNMPVIVKKLKKETINKLKHDGE